MPPRIVGIPFSLYIPWFSDIGIRLGDLFSIGLCFFLIGTKSILEEKADFILTNKFYKDAAQYYKECERISHFLLQMGKEKEIVEDQLLQG